MNRKDLIEKSILIITEYYKGNTKPYFDALCDNVLWFGPRAGQMLKGKDTMIQIWDKAETDTWFTMSNISAESVSTGRNNLEVMLEYYVYTHFHDGTVLQHHQRLHLSWGDTNGSGSPKIHMIHISNIAAETESGVKVYATTPDESRTDAIRAHIPDIPEKIISVNGMNDITYFFHPSSILWIESTDNAKHSIIHTPEQNCLSTEPVRTLEKKLNGYLLRCHTSYLVNPLFVFSIQRFSVTLNDGTVLPIPEKKYTSFKETLRKWNYNPEQ